MSELLKRSRVASSLWQLENVSTTITTRTNFFTAMHLSTILQHCLQFVRLSLGSEPFGELLLAECCWLDDFPWTLPFSTTFFFPALVDSCLVLTAVEPSGIKCPQIEVLSQCLLILCIYLLVCVPVCMHVHIHLPVTDILALLLVLSHPTSAYFICLSLNRK